jgi:tubulin-folding cofactor B
MNLKGKLELLTGAMSSSMRLELRDKDGVPIQKITDDSATLAQLNVQNGMRIHVIDTAPSLLEEDTPDVAFNLSKDEYEKREESALSFLKKNRLGRFDDEKMKQKQEQEERETKLAESIKAGDRCEVRVPGNPTRRGEVRFVGPVHFKEGIWVGIHYDEPMGKNDGSVGGKRYFESKPNYGGFVRPSHVTVGDFPEVVDLDEI